MIERVGGRPADALRLELLDEGRLREAWRRQRVVALRVDAEQLQAAIRDAGAVHAIALPRRRQERFLVFELRERIVAAFDVGAAEPGKLDRLPARGEHGRSRRGRDREFERRLLHARVDDLRRHGALPDQLVEAEVVRIENAGELLGREAEVGRPDRLVRFLRILHLGGVPARTAVVLGPEHLRDDARRFGQRLLAERRGVRAVIGDQAFHLAAADLDALEEALRDLHRAARRESQLAAGLLGERRRRERRSRPLGARPDIDAGDGPGGVPPHGLGEDRRVRFRQVPHAGRLEPAGGRVEILTGGHALVQQTDERGAETRGRRRRGALPGPSRWRCGTPGALPRAPPAGARPRSAHVPR